jgi:hypothetical protein
VSELVLLIAPVLQVDEDAQVVCSSNHTHACAFLGTVDVEGGDRRVVRRLLGKVGDGHGLAIAFDAVGSACGCGVGCLEGGMSILDLPVTL